MKRTSISLLIAILVLLVSVSGIAQDDPPTVPKIVFVTIDYEARTYTLHVSSPDGTNILPLVVGGQYWSPALSPDGRQLAFIGRRLPAGTPGIYVMNTDGTGLRIVTPPPSPVRVRPNGLAWSPDGTELMYGAIGSGSSSFFYRFTVDSDEQVRIRFPGIEYEDRSLPHPYWSPDGSKVMVYGMRVDPQSNLSVWSLYLANADGTDAVPFPAITDEMRGYSFAAWSPDGQQVVLASLGSINDAFPLIVANADGSDARRLAGHPPNYPHSPSWSPDGNQILFIAVEQGVESMPEGELYVVDADGSNLRALNIPGDVAGTGTAWGAIPADVILPSSPVELESAAR
ncbi:MAG: PD40 domain-containing protein [Chloroflexi bacterium]|nr:PD40 domain-containing protein [Chloroflexota bacterium]